MPPENSPAKEYLPQTLLTAALIIPLVCISSYFFYKDRQQNKERQRISQLTREVLKLEEGITLEELTETYKAMGIDLPPVYDITQPYHFPRPTLEQLEQARETLKKQD